MRDVRALDSVSFTDWFKGHGGSQASIDRMWCVPSALSSDTVFLLFMEMPHSCGPVGCAESFIVSLYCSCAERCGACACRNPVAYALGFLSCDDISARCMLSIFQFFATKTDASVLRMLNGSPADRLLAPIADYIASKYVISDLC